MTLRLVVSCSRALADAAVARAAADEVSIATLVRRALAAWAARNGVALSPCAWRSPPTAARCWRPRSGAYLGTVCPDEWGPVLEDAAAARSTTPAELVRVATAEHVGAEHHPRANRRTPSRSAAA
jgi:hypothetical protein